jgi:hypothetical protein
MAKVVALDARIAVKSLYKHDIKAIGRKLLGSSLFPFLYIRMVVEVFQTEGICLLFRQRLKMSDKTLQLGSTCRRWRYSTRSLPGAELDMCLSLSLMVFSDIGSMMLDSALAVGTCSLRDCRSSLMLIGLDEKVLVKYSSACCYVPV